MEMINVGRHRDDLGESAWRVTCGGLVPVNTKRPVDHHTIWGQIRNVSYRNVMVWITLLAPSGEYDVAIDLRKVKKQRLKHLRAQGINTRPCGYTRYSYWEEGGGGLDTGDAHSHTMCRKTFRSMSTPARLFRWLNPFMWY